MNFPLCGFKLPGHRLPAPALICPSAPLLWTVAFTTTGCSGSVPFPGTLCGPVTLHQWREQLRSCFGQHLPVSAHLPRATACPGWQWGRSSASSLSGRASCQLSRSDLGDVCRRWSCDDASPPHPPGFLCLLLRPRLTWPRSFWIFLGPDGMLVAKMQGSEVLEGIQVFVWYHFLSA